MNNLHGSCGCGEVEYILDSDPLNIINCHCNMCRSHNGSAFSTYIAVQADTLNISCGHDALAQYVASNGEKNFCSKCGTPLFSRHDKYPGISMIFLGTLNKTEGLIPKINIWSESQISWIKEITNIKSIPQG